MIKLAAVLVAAFLLGGAAPMPSNVGMVMFSDNPDRVCKMLFGEMGGGTALACATIGPDKHGINRMVLPNPCHPGFAGELYARVACHEIRHWRGEMHAPGSPRFADGG